jgi:hypothetical protein
MVKCMSFSEWFYFNSFRTDKSGPISGYGSTTQTVETTEDGCGGDSIHKIAYGTWQTGTCSSSRDHLSWRPDLRKSSLSRGTCSSPAYPDTVGTISHCRSFRSYRKDPYLERPNLTYSVRFLLESALDPACWRKEKRIQLDNVPLVSLCSTCQREKV